MTYHGKVEEVHDAKQLVWTIPAFSTLSAQMGTCYTCRAFRFAGEEFQLRMYPGGDRESARGHVSLILVRKQFKTSACHCRPVRLELGLKTVDGSAVVFQKSSVSFGPDGWGRSARLFPRDELVRHLMPSDVLILACILRQGDPMSEEFLESSRTSFAELGKLSENFRDLLADTKSCDTTLVVKGKEFPVHKSVLIARSPVFAAMFQHEMTEKKTGTVDIPDCDEGSFGTFLEYLYSGRASDVSFDSALELYRTSQKYDIPELKSFCAKCLTRNLTAANVTSAVVLADQYEEKQLMSSVQDYFNVHFGQIVVTEEWESLNRRDFHLANKLIVGASSYLSTLLQK